MYRTKVLNVRLFKHERRAVEQLAAIEGQPMSVVARRLLLEAAKRCNITIEPPQPKTGTSGVEGHKP